MTLRLFIAVAAAVAAASGCTELSEVAEGECGNRVLEPGEDCDGSSAFEGATCGFSESSAPVCRYTCTEDGAGCPTGWGCGQDRICRQPSGNFPADDDTSFTYPFRVDEFAVGDIDGDGNLDLIGNDAETITMRFGAGDGEFPASSTFLARAPTGAMSYGYFDNDELLDVLVPIDAGLFVLLGDESRSLVPVPYASLPLSADINEMRVEPVLVTGFPSMVTVGSTSQAGFIGLFSEEPVALPGGHVASDVIGPIAVGDLDSSALAATSELALAFAGEPALWLFHIVNVGTAKAPRYTLNRESITLPAPVSEMYPYVGLADVNLDGFLDGVAVVDGGAGPKVALALNDKAGALDAAVIDPTLDAIATAQVLEVGELGNVLGPEVVTAGGVFAPILDPETPIYEPIDPWAKAVITDINGDDLNDLVAAPAGESRIEILYGTAQPLPIFNPRSIVTEAPVKDLVAGDFDGDLIADVALVIDRGKAQSSLFVVFGALSGGPSAPIFTGDLQNIDDIAPISLLLRVGGGLGTTFDLITDLFVVSRPAGGAQLSLALFEGDASRRMVAPFKLFTETFDLYRPVQAVFGNFTDDEATDVVAVSVLAQAGEDAASASDSLVWVIPGKGEGGALDELAASFDAVTHAGNAGLKALGCSQWIPGDLDTRGESLGVDELVGLNYGQGCRSVAIDDPSAYVAKAANGVIDLGQPLDTSDSLLAPARLILTPLDADGANDLLVFYAGNPTVPDSAGFTVYWGGGDGSLAFNGQTVSDFGLGILADALGTEIQMRDIGAIDLDRDGFPEIAILTDHGVYYVTFAKDGDHKIYDDPKLLVPGPSPGAGRLVVADVNGDGIDDLAVTGADSVRIFLQDPAPALGDGAAAGVDGGAI